MPDFKKERGDVPENLLRPRDAAVQLQISYPTIKQWIYHRKLRAVKTPGGHYRIPQSEIDRLLYRTRGHNEGERRVTSSASAAAINSSAGLSTSVSAAWWARSTSPWEGNRSLL